MRKQQGQCRGELGISVFCIMGCGHFGNRICKVARTE